MGNEKPEDAFQRGIKQGRIGLIRQMAEDIWAGRDIEPTLDNDEGMPIAILLISTLSNCLYKELEEDFNGKITS